jgi:hypothetical protein
MLLIINKEVQGFSMRGNHVEWTTPDGPHGYYVQGYFFNMAQMCLQLYCSNDIQVNIKYTYFKGIASLEDMMSLVQKEFRKGATSANEKVIYTPKEGEQVLDITALEAVFKDALNTEVRVIV